MDGSWLTLGTVTLDQDSFYSYQLKTTKRSTRGTSAYRVTKPADTDHVAGSSRQVDITIR